jgi:hypothetical protein
LFESARVHNLKENFNELAESSKIVIRNPKKAIANYAEYEKHLMVSEDGKFKLP